MGYRKALLLQAVAAVLLSTGGLLIKIIAIHPLALASARSIIAAVVIGVYMGRPRFTGSLAQIGGAVALVGAQLFFVLATRQTTAANAIFIQYTAPVYVALFGIWFLREPARRLDWLTMAAIGAGMVLFFNDNLTLRGLWGNFNAMLAGISFAWFILFMRKQKDGSMVETVFLGNVLAALVGLPFLWGVTVTPADWGGVVFLGIFQLGLPFILMTVTMKHLTAVDAVLIQTLEPILNPVWVFLVIGENPGPLALLGGVIVVGAVTLRSFLTAQAQRRDRVPTGQVAKKPAG